MRKSTLILSTLSVFLFLSLSNCNEVSRTLNGSELRSSKKTEAKILTLYASAGSEKIFFLGDYNKTKALGIRSIVARFNHGNSEEVVFGRRDSKGKQFSLFINFGPMPQQLNNTPRWKDLEAIEYLQNGVFSRQDGFVDKYNSSAYMLQKGHIKTYYRDIKAPCESKFSQLKFLRKSSQFKSFKSCENLEVHISNDAGFASQFQIGHKYISRDNKSWMTCNIHLGLPNDLNDSLIEACMLSALDINESGAINFTDGEFFIAIRSLASY